MTANQPLSPAAQAVMDAVLNEASPSSEQRQQRMDAAAALRAAANDWRVDTEFMGGVEYIRTSTLERIAAELESQ
jgi:hypothetical protein